MVFTRLTVSRSTASAFAHSGPPASDRAWLAGPVGAGVPVAAAFFGALPPPQPARPITAAATATHSRPRRPALRAGQSRMPIAHLVPGPEPDRSRWRGPPPMGRITWTALPELRFPALRPSCAPRLPGAGCCVPHRGHVATLLQDMAGTEFPCR